MTDQPQTRDEPSLVDKMRQLADSGHPRAEELREKANALYHATEDFEVKHFMHCWSRARRLWCDITGEPLIR